ncbi:FAD-binding oxidoreductase [Streptomyces palmae]|uniref:FAD-binding oxidoreductase n=1 Tax=Streptomyces palmae TaxID=1701085 RepID=A0A4Z0G665_9ACTN|nr:FAD-binding oxidoreductase [Streptomyces palmae]TGA89914.1 FAD-binding oxidoreductase [Streptomyces palmae]
MIKRRTLLGACGTAAALTALHTAPARAHTPWEQLRGHLTGTLVLPEDPFYATARQLELQQYDTIAPQAVAYCVNAADVALCLAFAQHHDIPLAPRSGGHSLGGYSTTTGLIVDVSRLNRIALHGESVTFGPGAHNVDLLTTLAPAGLAVAGGACPTVAAGGFVQGGGLGFLTRPLGMACDALTSAQVVLADGRTVTASPQQHKDLFWAIRGAGGGNFGIVTSYTATPHPVTDVATSTLVFAYDTALDMIDGYTRWLAHAPRTIGGACVVTLADAAPGNTPVPAIRLVSTGTATELADETGRLLALTGPPATRTDTTLPYRTLMMGVYGCATKTTEQCHRADIHPEGQLTRPAFGLERSRMFKAPIARSGWASALAVFDAHRQAGQIHQLQVLPLGGADSDLDRRATAYVHRDSLFTTNYLATIPAAATDEGKAAARLWVDRGFAAIDPYSSGETYQNFIDPALTNWKWAYYAENYPRLSQTKAAYDPCGLFTHAQSIR